MPEFTLRQRVTGNVMRFLLLLLLLTSLSVKADIYSYNNTDGDYIVTQKKPTDPDITYAVLSEEGDFIRMVTGRNQQIPVGHWRPFWMPREPHPLEGDPDLIREREPVVIIEEEPYQPNQ